MSKYIKKVYALEIVKRTSGDYAAAFSEIRKLPAEDVAPVRHGRWIFHKPFDNGRHNCNECIECSVCNTWFERDCYAKTNYCPNCGAKMDLWEE